VRPQVFRLLDAIIASGDEGTASAGDWHVYVTGHSLGGALATLCAYELATREPSRRPRVTMYTFGAPRCGNRGFAEAFAAAVPDAWRVTNSNDIIPSVPRLMGYAHVPHGVRLTPDGTLQLEGATGGAVAAAAGAAAAAAGAAAARGRDVFGEGRTQLEVFGELLGRVSGREAALEEALQEITARELEVLDSLVNGSALEEHMEEFYLATLRAAVAAYGGGGSGGDGTVG